MTELNSSGEEVQSRDIFSFLPLGKSFMYLSQKKCLVRV